MAPCPQDNSLASYLVVYLAQLFAFSANLAGWAFNNPLKLLVFASDTLPDSENAIS